MTSHTKHHDAQPADGAPRISAIELSKVLNQPYPPTEQQAAIIEAPPGPLLVVAGAGAGKTETMAARVVWLVANGYVEPENVLGLTFTRKAARQLNQRIRRRLEQLKASPGIRDIDPSGTLKETLTVIEPTIATYDSFAGSIVREFGLLAPVEPDSRIVSTSQLIPIIQGVVEEWEEPIEGNPAVSTVIEDLRDLADQMTQHIVSSEEVREETEAFHRLCIDIPKAPRQRDALNGEMTKVVASQARRLQYLRLLDRVNERLARERLSTFGQQMAAAADVSCRFPQVGKSLRQRYHVVMLDEYQDTSHAQRVLLSELFGKAVEDAPSVTAVGDPMQAIYGWRGATASNLNQFIHDFPAADGSPAPRQELTTSWRNPIDVLGLANEVTADIYAAHDANREVSPLEARLGADKGSVTLGYSRDREDERRRVADLLATRYHCAREAGEHFTGAVLVRKNADIEPIAAELRARGVPVDLVGIGGLLQVPEVHDVLCIARMLVQPEDTSSALRILSGPMVGLGAKDIQALSRRAVHLSTRMLAEGEEDEIPVRYPEDELLSELERRLRDTSDTEENLRAGITDALADPGDQATCGYSAEGYRRITHLAALLRQLRQRGLDRPVPDILADIMQLTGLRTEVLARETPHADGASGTVHLDRLLEEAGSFSDVPGATLLGFLRFCELAARYDNGLEPGEVIVRSDRVQILTVHKAKGLEWQHVAVLHADAGTYGPSTKSASWPKSAKLLPSALRGDAGLDSGAPLLDSDVENRKELENAIKAYADSVKDVEREENDRLFYVAMTRAEQSLIISASAYETPSAAESDARKGSHKAAAPHPFLASFAKKHPELVGEEWWWMPASEGDASDTPRAAVLGSVDARPCFPHLPVPPEVQSAAEDVRAALNGNLPEAGTAELHELWESDVNALIEEHEKAQKPVIDVELSRRLTVSDMVRLRENPQWFARRLRRPVPFKPQSFAKRGTAFHSWLEDFFGASSLLDDTELLGMEEEEQPYDLAELKEKFLESAWADRTPAFVEKPFELFLGSRVIRGRMDAIFPEPDGGWFIVDWKTGQPPREEREKNAAVIQLAAYAVAWEEICRQAGEEKPRVRAAFHYVAAGRTVEPEHLPTREELVALLDD
ncbi:DEAD/DEAH box helicase [Corynebacterium uropygiale]|uniref:DNA 3'-5' helicase n=1 Tax=Corynebacterium uropygiale TaxID=1775911 RepID=A0A9X1U050_9CORY|nr:UvrD-helicase domain-containing protein [Corynebacterium uropygiale]MCF4006093.1 DEAD/DEAH box helicase [Corynebacterium uropygiale]